MGGRVLRALGWTVLWVSAVLGVAMAGVAAFAASSFGRPVVAGLLVAQADAAVAGRITLQGIEVLPQGGLELRGLEVYDPDGHLVLQVSRARLFADLTRLRSRIVGVVLDLDHPSVLLESEAGGSVSLVRAFAPTNPSPAPERAGPVRPTWTLRLTRLTLRGGDVWWQDEEGVTRLEATDVDLDAEASYGPQGGFLELTGKGDLSAPVEGASTLAVAAHLDGDALSVPALAATVGATRLEGLGEADLGRRSFRAAVTRLGVTPKGLAALAPGARLGGELSGTLYAESDGRRATAALAVTPGAAGAAGAGRGRAAFAARLPPEPLAVGFDVDAAALDPARLVAQAPPGQVTLTARGAAIGPWTAAGARGRLDLALAPSRLRGGALGPVVLRGTTDRGAVVVEKLDAVLPGLAASGSGRWRDQGAVAGALSLDASDLALAGRNLTALGVPGVPALAGRASAQLALSGTTAAPALRGTVEAPQVRVGDLRVEGARLQVEAAGPLATARGRVSGSVRRLAEGASELRGITLEAGLAGDEAALTASAQAPDLGTDPISVKAGALLAKDRRSATLRELSMSWPGTRYALAQPAQVTFAAPPGQPPAGPSVDRLELADGARRLVLTGGFGPKEALDARVEARRLDLARLPRGLVPASLGLGGLLDVTARATGSSAMPKVEATLSVTGGAVRGVAGLSLAGSAAWDGPARRLSGDARLDRAEGGTLAVTADLGFPAPGARGRDGAARSATATATGWPIALLRRLAGDDTPVTGTLAARAALSGTAAAPALTASVTLTAVEWEDLGPFTATATLDDPGDVARLTLETTHAGGRLLTGTGAVPLDVAALLVHPGPVARGLATAPLTVALDVPGADLAPFAGRAGLPEVLAGTLTGTAALTGTVAAPRGTVALTLRDGVAGGWREVGATVEGAMEAARTTLAARVTLGREEALRLTGSLAVPPEGFVDRAALRRAALALDATVPPLTLERAVASATAATGQVAAHLAVKGTLAAPVATLDADAASLALEGRPLGDLTATARLGPSGATAELAFRATAGGALRAAGGLDTPLGIDADRAVVARAPARLRVTSENLDLGFLPAVLPGLVRTAAGRLDVEITAAGPLEELAPRGTVKLAAGRVAVAEYGEWSELEVQATLTDHALEVPVLSARRGGGTLSGHLTMKDLGQAKASVDGKLTFKQFTLARAGMDIVTLDLSADLGGTATPAGANVTVTVSPGTVKLPRKIPRTLQSLERRTDIVVGRPKPAAHAPVLPGAGGKPFDLRLRLVIPGRVFVKSDSPRLDVEIKGDTTWFVEAGELHAEGSLEVVRGTAEPINGRLFVLDRGKVQFSGEGYKAAVVDVVARYDNPLAVVTANIGGWLGDPDVKLTSRPTLDEASIAMLIATGRTELKTGTSEVGTLTGKDAGISAMGALMVNWARDLVSDKLPVDSFSVASDSLRTGKYLTDKIFVGYTRRFEARPEKGENPDEVRVEYQITPRWQLESRYGNAQSGGASLIWSRDY